MGNWAIIIRGVGCHHNANLRADANRMAARFVEQLVAHKHMILSATFTHGGEDNINAAGYELACEKNETGGSVGHPKAIEAYSAVAAQLGGKSWDELPTDVKMMWNNLWWSLTPPDEPGGKLA